LANDLKIKKQINDVNEEENKQEQNDTTNPNESISDHNKLENKEEGDTEKPCITDELEDYGMPYDGTCCIDKAHLIFMSAPTLSPFESGVQQWAGMGGVWNHLNDVMLVFSDEIETFGKTIDFEKQRNDLIKSISMKQPEITKPMYDITFYFDNPLSISNNVQSVIFECIIKGKKFPEKINHEPFEDVASALHLFGGGWTNSNQRAYTTYVKSSTEQNDNFDKLSCYMLSRNDDMLFSKMKFEDEWILAATTVVPTNVSNDDKLEKSDLIQVIWQNIIIGYVQVYYKKAKSGNFIVTLFKNDTTNEYKLKTMK
jgi:hypothetical protein